MIMRMRFTRHFFIGGRSWQPKKQPAQEAANSFDDRRQTHGCLVERDVQNRGAEKENGENDCCNEQSF
ncbi:hypothetical protein KBC59_04870, partial [Patescibacteria group bacterium]|nr:hypothetical protein [Patescibacteria group bacterium]